MFFLKIFLQDRLMILKICNCCVFASLLVYSNFPVYYLWRFFANLPICCTFLVYYLARICQPPPLFRPRLLFETQEYMDTDSFVIHIKTEDFYKDIADDAEMI